MAFNAELTRSTAAQAVVPSSEIVDLLGTTGANLVLLTGAVQNATAAPRDGLVIVGMPSGSSARIRIGAGAVAVLTDPLYPGPMVWHFPVREGEEVSIYPETDATITVCMAK